mgnify:CR=1 FL=1|jgi:drug/metabolite transporter (DMT)-like permease
MHISFIIIIILSAFAQSCSWSIRKKLLNIQKVNTKTIIIVEYLMISMILFSYIFLTSDTKNIYKEIHIITKREYGYLFLTSIMVVGAMLSIYYLMPFIDVSTLSPMLSIIRIITLAILGYFIFNEKMSIKKITALVFMVTGVMLIMH